MEATLTPTWLTLPSEPKPMTAPAQAAKRAVHPAPPSVPSSSSAAPAPSAGTTGRTQHFRVEEFPSLSTHGRSDAASAPGAWRKPLKSDQPNGQPRADERRRFKKLEVLRPRGAAGAGKETITIAMDERVVPLMSSLARPAAPAARVLCASSSASAAPLSASSSLSAVGSPEKGKTLKSSSSSASSAVPPSSLRGHGTPSPPSVRQHTPVSVPSLSAPSAPVPTSSAGPSSAAASSPLTAAARGPAAVPSAAAVAAVSSPPLLRAHPTPSSPLSQGVNSVSAPALPLPSMQAEHSPSRPGVGLASISSSSASPFSPRTPPCAVSSPGPSAHLRTPHLPNDATATAASVAAPLHGSSPKAFRASFPPSSTSLLASASLATIPAPVSPLRHSGPSKSDGPGTTATTAAAATLHHPAPAPCAASPASSCCPASPALSFSCSFSSCSSSSFIAPASPSLPSPAQSARCASTPTAAPAAAPASPARCGCDNLAEETTAVFAFSPRSSAIPSDAGGCAESSGVSCGDVTPDADRPLPSSPMASPPRGCPARVACDAQLSRSVEAELDFMRRLGWEGTYADLMSESDGLTEDEIASFKRSLASARGRQSSRALDSHEEEGQMRAAESGDSNDDDTGDDHDDEDDDGAPSSWEDLVLA